MKYYKVIKDFKHYKVGDNLYLTPISADRFAENIELNIQKNVDNGCLDCGDKEDMKKKEEKGVVKTRENKTKLRTKVKK